jgi:hypothetical protein
MGVEAERNQEQPLANGEFAVRVLWIALRLVAVFWMAEAGQSFIYQAF